MRNYGTLMFFSESFISSENRVRLIFTSTTKACHTHKSHNDSLSPHHYKTTTLNSTTHLEMTSTANLTTSYVLMTEDQNSAIGELSYIPVSTIMRLGDGSTLHLDEKDRKYMVRMVDMDRRLEKNLISKLATHSDTSAVGSTRVSHWYRPKDHWLFFGL